LQPRRSLHPTVVRRLRGPAALSAVCRIPSTLRRRRPSRGAGAGGEVAGFGNPAQKRACHLEHSDEKSAARKRL